MSRYIKDFCTKAEQNFNLGEKLKASYSPGSRILPARNTRNDAEYQMRLDAGELIGTRRNIYLQVNSQAKATPLKDWIRKNKTHANLASASFDTAAKDPQAEAARTMQELEQQAKRNI